MSIYTFKTWDGRTSSLEAILETGFTKEEVVRLVGVEQRRHNLIAALEALRNAGELDLAHEMIQGPRYGKMSGGKI